MIDEQHQGIFRLAERVYLAAQEGESEDVRADTVYGLADYVVEHFADEEELMVRSAYPGAGVHRSLHEHLATETTSLVARYFNGEDVHLGELASFVADWLREHIMQADMDLVRHLLRESAPQDMDAGAHRHGEDA